MGRRAEKLAAFIERAKPSGIAAIAGDQPDVESMFALKNLMNRLGSPQY